MPGLTILSPGPYSTIQDHGRTGRQAVGVPQSGAMDYDALVTGNWLVGNLAHAGGIEVYMGGINVVVDTKMAIALTGTTNDRLRVTSKTDKSVDYPAGMAIMLEAGDCVFLPPLRHSHLGFIALSGEIDLPLIYGSLSTSPNAQLGGHMGRRLEEGDQLTLRPAKSPVKWRELSQPGDFFSRRTDVRIVLGPQDFAFPKEQINRLLAKEWTISHKMNRMGIRLMGPQITHNINADILSDGIVKGAIQIPGDGQPIIMMADHQTTGGYTKIAVVISADLPALARLPPHTKIRFHSITQEQAEIIAREHAALRDTLMT